MALKLYIIDQKVWSSLFDCAGVLMYVMLQTYVPGCITFSTSGCFSK